jgi:hypothetical protein
LFVVYRLRVAIAFFNADVAKKVRMPPNNGLEDCLVIDCAEHDLVAAIDFAFSSSSSGKTLFSQISFNDQQAWKTRRSSLASVLKTRVSNQASTSVRHSVGIVGHTDDSI